MSITFCDLHVYLTVNTPASPESYVQGTFWELKPCLTPDYSAVPSPTSSHLETPLEKPGSEIKTLLRIEQDQTKENKTKSEETRLTGRGEQKGGNPVGYLKQTAPPVCFSETIPSR